MANDADNLKKTLEEIQKLYKAVFSKPISIESDEFKSVATSLEKANDYAKTLKELFLSLKSPVNDIRTEFLGIVQELSKNSVVVARTRKEYGLLYNTAAKIRDINTADYTSSNKKIKQISEELRLRKEELTSLQKSLALRKNDLEAQKKISTPNLNYKESRKRIAEINEELKDINKAEKGIAETLLNSFSILEKALERNVTEITTFNDKMGLMGTAVDGIDGALREIGAHKLADRLGLQQAINSTKDFTNEAGKNASKWAVAKNFTGNIVSNLTKGIGLTAVIVAAYEVIKKIVDLMVGADKQVTKIANNFTTTKEQASEIRSRLFQISDSATVFANTSKGVLLTYSDIAGALDDINESLGISVDFTNTLNGKGSVLLSQYANAKENLGLNSESLKEALIYSQGQNKSFNDILGNVILQNYELGKQGQSLKGSRQSLNEVLKVTGDIRANFKGSLEEITKGVAKASLMGTTLEQINKVQESLLDFESSIQNELEAELLTNRNLNLERARGFALVGDMNGLMNELNNNAISFGEFTKLNIIGQEAFAKAIGMSRGDLSDILFQKQALGEISKQLNKEQFKVLDQERIRLQQLGKSTTEINEGVKTYAFQLIGQQDVQQKFNKALVKVQEIFTRLVDGGVLDRLADVLTKLINFVSGKEAVGKSIMKQAESNPELKKKLDEAYKEKLNFRVQQAMMNKVTAAGMNGDVVEREKAKIASEINVKDFVIKTLPQDTVVAAGGTKMGNNDEILKKLQDLIDAVNKGGNIYLDGTRVSQKVEPAMAITTRRTQ